MIYFDFFTGKINYINPLGVDESPSPGFVDFGQRNLEGDIILDTGYRSAEDSVIDLQERV